MKKVPSVSDNVPNVSIKEKPEIVRKEIELPRKIQVFNFASTTGKVRCLTAQFNKMLEPAFASIDGFVIFYHDGANDLVIETEAFYMDNQEKLVIRDQPVYPPLSWPSDHAMISATTPYGKILSVNAFGESIGETIPLNIFEIFTGRCWNRFQADEAIRNEFHRLKTELMDSTYQVIGSPEASKFKDLVKAKHFSRLSRAYAVINNVFLVPKLFLCNPNAISNRDFFTLMMTKYNEAYQAYISDIEMKKRQAMDSQSIKKFVEANEIEHVVTTILTFFNTCMSSPILEPFFNDWYRELEETRKMTIVELLFDLMKPGGDVACICLQEVSEGMMNQFFDRRLEFLSLGYSTDAFDEGFDRDTNQPLFKFKYDLAPGEDKPNKTRGIIFYKQKTI
jgi:hypothetical protein